MTRNNRRKRALCGTARWSWRTWRQSFQWRLRRGTDTVSVAAAASAAAVTATLPPPRQQTRPAQVEWVVQALPSAAPGLAPPTKGHRALPRPRLHRRIAAAPSGCPSPDAASPGRQVGRNHRPGGGRQAAGSRWMIGWSGPGSAGHLDPPPPARECVPHRTPAPHLLHRGPHLSAPAAYTLPPVVVTLAAGRSVIPGTWWL